MSGNDNCTKRHSTKRREHTNVVQTSSDYDLANDDDTVIAQGEELDEGETLDPEDRIRLRLPSNPALGQEHHIVALDQDLVVTACHDICGEDDLPEGDGCNDDELGLVVPACTLAHFVFAEGLGKCTHGVWVSDLKPTTPTPG